MKKAGNDDEFINKLKEVKRKALD